MSYFILAHPEARRRAIAAVDSAPEGHMVKISPPPRGLDANAMMWVYLEAFARQLQWPVNGAMVKLSAEDWKTLLTAAYKNETQRMAMGLDGGVVMLGMRTSKMGKRQFSEFIEFLQSVAADRNVVLPVQE